MSSRSRPVLVRVRDKAGNESRTAVVVVKGQQPLPLSLDTAPVTAGGQLVFWGHIADADQVGKLEYRMEFGAWMPLPASHGSFAVAAELPAGPVVRGESLILEVYQEDGIYTYPVVAVGNEMRDVECLVVRIVVRSQRSDFPSDGVPALFDRARQLASLAEPVTRNDTVALRLSRDSILLT